MSARKTFFAVDDDALFLELLATLLKKAGHEVTAFASGVEVLDEVIEKKPDCVLIDIFMPEMDGLELCRAIRAHNDLAATKIIIISAKNYEFDKKRAMEFGANGYIVKPFDPDSIADQIEDILTDSFALTFWGVRGTLPVPGQKSIRYGGNTPCVSLNFQNGDWFIFDCGSGIKELSNHLMASGAQRLTAKIFISHPHWDHINAFPFFVPLYIPGNDVEVFGASHGDITMRELISNQMDGVYFPVTMREFGARVYFHDLREEKIRINGAEISTMLLSHPGYCLGYRVDYHGRSICYITDNELFLPGSQGHNPNYVERLKDFIRGADALITDCTYFDEDYDAKVGWGHSCISQVVDLAHGGEVETLYLFHHDPDQDDTAIERKHALAQAALKALGSNTKCLAPAEGDRFVF